MSLLWFCERPDEKGRVEADGTGSSRGFYEAHMVICLSPEQFHIHPSHPVFQAIFFYANMLHDDANEHLLITQKRFSCIWIHNEIHKIPYDKIKMRRPLNINAC